MDKISYGCVCGCACVLEGKGMREGVTHTPLGLRGWKGGDATGRDKDRQNRAHFAREAAT